MEVGVNSVVVCAAVRVDSSVHKGLKRVKGVKGLKEVKVKVQEQCQRVCPGTGPGDVARSASSLQGGPPSSDGTCITHTTPHKRVASSHSSPLHAPAVLQRLWKYGNQCAIACMQLQSPGAWQQQVCNNRSKGNGVRA